jgi:hypothetical protein
VPVSDGLENCRCILKRNPAQTEYELRQRKTTRNHPENLNRLEERRELPQESGGLRLLLTH